MQASAGSAAPFVICSVWKRDGVEQNLQDNTSTGLTHPDSVPNVIHFMKQLTNQGPPNPAEISSERNMIAAVIAATDQTDCLDRLVQLDVLPLLGEWLQQAHQGGGKSGHNDNTAEEEENLILVLLSALEKLPVDLLTLRACVIGRNVNNLRTHRNAEIQKKARRLVEIWKRQIDSEIMMQSAEASNNRSRIFATEIPVEASCNLYAKAFCSNEVSETLILGSKEGIADHILVNSGSLVEPSTPLSHLSSSYARISSPNRLENKLLGYLKSSQELQTRSIMATNSCEDEKQMDGSISDLCLCKERSSSEEAAAAEVNYKLASVCHDIASAGIDLLATVAVNEKLSVMDHTAGDHAYADERQNSDKNLPELGQVWISPTRSSSSGTGSTAIEGGGAQLIEERVEEEEYTGSRKLKSEKINMDSMSTEEEDVLEVARQVATEVNIEMERHIRPSSFSSSSVLNQTSDGTDIAPFSHLNFDLNQEATLTNQGPTSSNSSSSLTAPTAILAATKGVDFIPIPITPLRSNNGWKGSAATSAFRRAEPKARKPVFDFDLNIVAGAVGKEEDSVVTVVAIDGRPLLDLNCLAISEEALIITQSNEQDPSKKSPPLNIDLNDGPSSQVAEYHDSSLTNFGKNACMTSGLSTHVDPSGIAESGRRPSFDLNAGPEECTRDELHNTWISPIPYSMVSLQEGFLYNPHSCFHRPINYRGMESPFKRKEPPGGAWPPVQGHQAFKLPTWR